MRVNAQSVDVSNRYKGVARNSSREVLNTYMIGFKLEFDELEQLSYIKLKAL